jgi:site-specific recombinase XerD
LAIKLLLSGVDRNELLRLNWDQWEDADQQSTLELEHDRSLSLSPAVAESMRQCMESSTNADQTVLMNVQREALTLEALDTMVNLAAYDAGVVEPERVDAESLQHTYRIYLLQQGVRLGELERYVGPLLPEVIRQYRTYASPSAAENRDEIDALYPALNSTQD